jgi:anionic cell wall polymer biosynthesis LytR-Cps2A-Psr (LCP) family protein
MNGDWALAYSRARKFTTGGDFNRTARQQEVLRALRNGLDPCKFVQNPASITQLLGHIYYAFHTNMPIEDAPQWLSLAKGITGGAVQTVTLAPGDPNAADPDKGGTGQPSVNVPKGSPYWYPTFDDTSLAWIRNMAYVSLDKAPTATGSGGGGGGGGGGGC